MNKTDLTENRQVDNDEVLQYINDLNNDSNSKIIHSECSAKLGEGVLDIFDQIARSLPIDDINKKVNGNKRISGVDLGRNIKQNQNLQQNNSCC